MPVCPKDSASSRKLVYQRRALLSTERLWRRFPPTFTLSNSVHRVLDQYHREFRGCLAYKSRFPRTRVTWYGFYGQHFRKSVTEENRFMRQRIGIYRLLLLQRKYLKFKVNESFGYSIRRGILIYIKVWVLRLD